MHSCKNSRPGSSNVCITVTQLRGPSEKRFSLGQIARTFVYLTEPRQSRIVCWSSLQDVFVLLFSLAVLPCSHISLSQN
jgi:hypothetical protein